MNEIVHKKGKIYYSIGEVAELFDVNTSLIRFWEKKFNVLKPHKNKKGTRMFTPQDVDNFKLIYHLVKERGMTLAGAQQRLRDNKDGAIRDMEIVDKLLSIRAMLVEIREELRNDGEIFTPEGYLDEEEYVETTHGASKTSVRDAVERNEITLIAEEVRTKVVTDGSSPWDEPGQEDADESVNEAARDAAMGELRDVKNILAGWNNTADGYQSEAAAASRADGGNASDDLGGLGNIFDDDLDATNDYADPWEEVGDSEPTESISGSLSDDAGNDRPKPGDVFGTDACTTFSPDDSEAAITAEESPKKPQIYEQTLF